MSLNLRIAFSGFVSSPTTNKHVPGIAGEAIAGLAGREESWCDRVGSSALAVAVDSNPKVSEDSHVSRLGKS